MQTLIDLLACPRCERALESTLENEKGALRCSTCRVTFPSIANVPWLFAEPDASLDEWRGRLHFALQRGDREVEQLRAALARGDQRAATRERLEHLASATAEHGKRLRELLAPLELGARSASYAVHLALRTRLPADQGLTTYYANVHRDWAWGDDENAASAAIVDGLIADAAPKRVLVLGSGAGRLAYDVHRLRNPDTTVALDFNPLLVLLAAAVTRGERVDLHEFPLAPRGVAEQAVLRTLAAPSPAAPGLEHVLADAHRPPFKRGAFDAVLTPWLVDILPERFDVFAARVNSLLAAGGLWINFGSLSFHDPDPSARLTPGECAAAMEANGFGAVALEEHEIPYLCSPASRHGRRERVVAWRAVKQSDVKEVPRYYALPDWIVRGTEPVPLTESFQVQSMSTRIHAFMMSLIDGRRSLKDMAKLIVEQRLMSADEAESAVRTFLIKMHDDSRRGGLY